MVFRVLEFLGTYLENMVINLTHSVPMEKKKNMRAHYSGYSWHEA